MNLKRGEKLGYYENNNNSSSEIISWWKGKSINAIVKLPKKEIYIDYIIKQFNNKIYEEIINRCW